ncbi:MAG: ACP S-malonyltransferase [Gammaproteobacteria bacterium]|nr:ACP S-malonyltransferase [Gammaproteobacteria bacterium]
MTDRQGRVMLVFPGQGAQYPGMGSDLFAAFDVVRELYEQASSIVGYDLARLSFEDPDGQLNFTRFTQPALLTHELACWRALQSLAGAALAPELTAGHSLGEYSALVAAGSLDFASALQLVQRRGELMGELGEGGMLATTLDLEHAHELADRFFCGIGGCNLPEQTVIAGADADLTRLAAELKEKYPRKRAIPLQTEGAFHTFLMVSAARQFRPVLEAVDFNAPQVSVLSNFTGKPHGADADGIRSRLFFQLFHPVRWIGCMNTAMEAGVDTIVELGGGIGKGDGPEGKRPNLEGIIKKSLKWRDHDADYLGAINTATIEAAAESLAQ